ncbi:hypothetical protein O181_097157 [Austropuccinia psidii MF-1]|uniref:Uncharacterized protein n=1 Tax=Austropuccinia psidii MF-1 TaxID=1389203 RepID=A0A9Q3J813_9BASI|nr:hypothetical protein [Austropuccinia psidii MF-1]
MNTMNNVLKPLVNMLVELNGGVKICTGKFPKGRAVVIKLVNLIGDIVANHKVAGFKSHAARKFCSWCDIEDHQRVELKLGNLHNRKKVLALAHQWREIESIKRREDAAKKHGIRWSELNRLTYWDPIMSVPLGVMHNWYEGVLQHHFQYRWGFDLIDIGRRSMFEDDSDEEEDAVFRMDVDNDEEMGAEVGYLSEELKEKIRKRIQEVVVPKGVTRIPREVGSAGNGKLKASEWRALFGIYIPLAVLDVFWNVGSNKYNLLINTGALIECTRILGATSNVPEDSVRFGQTYQSYQQTSKVMFPNLRVTPNHHYAMHFPDQLKWWGPMMGVSEFAGERLVGCMEETIMNKFGQMQQMQDRWNKDLPQDAKVAKSGKQKELDDAAYDVLLDYMRQSKRDFKDYRKLPHVNEKAVLRNYVTAN